MNLEEKKKKRVRKTLKLIDGVVGTEISLFVKNYIEPEIKITFLHLEKKIYEDFVRVFIKEGFEKDEDIIRFVDWFKIENVMWKFEKVNEIYELIYNLMENFRNQNIKMRNFNIRHLNLNPLYQAKLPHPNYKEYKGE
jgi:hypothetical protein